MAFGCRRAWLPGVFILLFAALTVLMTWPLPAHAGSAVQDLGDPLYEIWTMRWPQHQLVRDPAHLWDGNTAYPFRLSVLFSEARLSTAVLAWPLQLATGNDVLVYNLMFMASFVALGAGMALLVDEISGSAGAALLAGILAAYTTYRYGHLSHLNLLSYGWLPLGLWALVRFSRERRMRHAFLAAIFLTIQVLASDTLALMTMGMVALALPFLLWPARRPPGEHQIRPYSRRLVAGIAVAVGLPLLALVPIVLGRLEVNRVYGFTRDLDTVRQMSATLKTYLSVSPFNHFWVGKLPTAYPNPLFPGAVALVGALLALALAWRCYPRWALYGTLTALVGLVLSLGPESVVAGRQLTLPYLWLYDHVPGFTSMRDVARFGTVTLLGVQLLAGLGFAAAWERLRPRLPARFSLLAGACLLAALITAALVESRSTVDAVEVSRDPATVAAYDWLATQPRGPVFELPANGLWTDVLSTTAQIYYSTRNWQPIVAGYTSFLPDRYMGLMVGINGGPQRPSRIDASNVGVLQDLGVRYVLIHHVRTPDYDWRAAVALADQLPELRRVGDLGNTSVYLLSAGQREPVRFALTAPDTALAGGTFPGVLVVDNDNSNQAITTLDRPPVATATWSDDQGKVVLTTHTAVNVPVVIGPGHTLTLVRSAVPATPGRYRLRLTFDTLAAPIDTGVQVRTAPLEVSSGPAVTLRAVTWPDRPVHPGENVEVDVRWLVNRRPGMDYIMTTQIIGPDNQVLAQSDGAPFLGELPISRWEPSMELALPVTVRIPPGAPPGDYRVLVALYDSTKPALPRLEITLPDGRVGHEFDSGTLTVAAP